jgi:hypothetical protein
MSMIRLAVQMLPGRFAAWYDTMYTKHPFSMAAATMGCKASSCDIIAQKIRDPDCVIDYKRTGKFTVFCISYVGCFQHFVFNIFYPRLFPGTGFKVAVKKALFDNFVHSPFLYLPTYYVYKNITDMGSIKDGLNEYNEEGFDVLKSCWGLWLPAQLVGFYFIPANFRILYNAGVGCLWEILLSYVAPLEETKKKKEDFGSLPS